MLKKTSTANRFLLIYSGITTIALAMMLMAFRNVKESFEEISVKRINIVDEQGHNRIVISNEEHMPPPLVGGKTYKRIFNPAGFVFYDEKGNECGGIALANPDKKTGVRALAFDYNNSDAIGLMTQEDIEGNHFRSGFAINDKKPGGPVGSGVNRVMLHTVNGVAGLEINGPDGKVRIRLTVDTLGNPLFETIDAKGKVVKKVF
ncbi:hypothetical protein [Chitinophaga vietnamensis]|uniref:hypothetical protein n=1 Tax=Chitinophaga vietnamensis TaxID=2593957 RepID=UPI0011775681|nr:hypothetical protein [Chitinophaga vietnamensis]